MADQAAGADVLASNCTSWTEGHRRATRWLAVLLAGIGAILLDQVTVGDLLRSSDQVERTVVALITIVLGVLLGVVPSFLAQSDAEADVGYIVRNRPEDVVKINKPLTLFHLPLAGLKAIAVDHDDTGIDELDLIPSGGVAVEDIPDLLRRSISSCGPFPLWIRTTAVSSPYASEYVVWPPSASAQYAASRSVC